MCEVGHGYGGLSGGRDGGGGWYAFVTRSGGWEHVGRCHVISCQEMSCHVILCQEMSCHMMSCQEMSYDVMSGDAGAFPKCEMIYR